MNIDMDNLKVSLSAANSALKVSVVADEMERNQRIATEISRQSARRDATLVAGAEASIEQKNILEQQLIIVREQNRLLHDNYEKLKELYEIQVEANKEASVELGKSKRFNAWMMVIAIIAMFAAIASPIVTLWVS